MILAGRTSMRVEWEESANAATYVVTVFEQDEVLYVASTIDTAIDIGSLKVETAYRVRVLAVVPTVEGNNVVLREVEIIDDTETTRSLALRGGAAIA